MYSINTVNGDIHFPDGTILSCPYDDVKYHEYADWVAAGNTPTEISVAVAQPIPTSVSRFQVRAALLQYGLLDYVNAIMADPTTPALAKLAWSDAQEFLRDSPTVVMLGNTLGLSATDLDNLFALAATIKA